MRNVHFLTEREKDRKHLPTALFFCFCFCVRCIKIFLVLLMLLAKILIIPTSKNRSTGGPSGLCKSARPIRTLVLWPD